MRRRRKPTANFGISSIMIGAVLTCGIIGIIGARMNATAGHSSQPGARPSPTIVSNPPATQPLAAMPTPAPALPTATQPSPKPHSASPTPLPTGTTPTIAVACLEGLAWEPATLVRVIDGDTIDVRINSSTERVRYIGVNTPERNQPGYSEATQANRSLVESGPLWLARDVSERDRFGRLLRYVIAGEQFVNLALVEQGMAQAATFPPDVRCADTYLAAQQQARENGAGLWANRPALAQPTVVPATGQQCHPAYPDVCIPPPPPNLDCRDIPHRRFRVDWTYGDPHGFDGDRDGIGCER